MEENESREKESLERMKEEKEKSLERNSKRIAK
jgi:hypothetical protein